MIYNGKEYTTQTRLISYDYLHNKQHIIKIHKAIWREMEKSRLDDFSSLSVHDRQKGIKIRLK